MPGQTPAPKKSLGQHFLNSPAICRKIIGLLNPQAEDQILEIGPGPGALTVLLEHSPHSRLVLLEKDNFWAGERLRMAGENTTVLNVDALSFAWPSLCADGIWKIIGNLPYNVASPLIWDILSRCACLQQAVFMVQKEVGQRLCASPGNKNYGALSVWTQSFARVKMEFSVGPGVFSPPPKVDSAVLCFWPLPLAQWPKNPERLNALLKVCFQSRRKQLGGIFRRAGLDNMLAGLEALDIAPSMRPENLSPGQFQSLAEYWRNK